MLIARSTASANLHPRIRGAMLQAAANHPEIALRADFDVGPQEHVEVFSAPDFGSAREMFEQVSAIAGVRAELAPLKHRW